MMGQTQAIPVCIIGGGLSSAIGRTHEIALRMDHRFKVLAGCFSRDPEINQSSAQMYGLPHQMAFNSPQDMLKAVGKQIQAVVIATPTHNHHEHIHLALDHGKQVITDKPLLANLFECSILLERIDPQGADVICLFNYCGYPAVRELRRRVLNGELGEVYRVIAEMPQDSYMRLANQGLTDTVQTWRLKDGDISSLSLDLFVHLDSLIQFTTGRTATSVYARSRSVSDIAPGLVDDVDATIDYDNGLSVNAWYSKVALGYRNGLSLRFLGTQGSATWVQEVPETLEMTNEAGDQTRVDRISQCAQETLLPRYNRFKAGHPAGFIEAFANYYHDVADALREGQLNENLLSVEQAVMGLRLCQAIETSSINHERVCIHDVTVRTQSTEKL